MTTLVFLLSGFSVLMLVYALWGRDWLKKQSFAQGFFAWVEPIEIALFRKSPTILFARIKMLGGVILTLMTQLGEIDITPLMPLVPEKWQGVVRVSFNMLPMILTFMGTMDEKQRNATTLPIEVVAVPDKVIAENPVVAEAVATAVVAKETAVAAVAEQKAAI